MWRKLASVPPVGWMTGARRMPIVGGVRAALGTAAGKRRVIGVVLLLAILLPFAAFNRLPKLDTVRADLQAALAPTAECFQGFCVEAEPQSSFLTRWWRFSLTYLQLVAIGMAFAFLAGGIAEAFLAPPGASRRQAAGPVGRILKGLGLGPVVNLCSACIVPVSSAVRRRGLGIEGALALVHGSATLNVPSLLMIAVVFSPLLGASRVLLGLAAAFLLGPLVVRVAGHATEPEACDLSLPAAAEPDPGWAAEVRQGLRRWARATGRMAVRMGPIMVVAGMLSGAAIQFLQPATVDAFLGDSVAGIAVAATLGVLINVPLLFEIPLVALLLLLGAGSGPAAALLFAAAAGGPITFWGLSRALRWKGIGTYALGTWAIAMAGGLAVLGASRLLPQETPALRIPAAASTTHVERAAPDPAVVGDTPIRFTDVAAAAGVGADRFFSGSTHSLGVNWVDVDADGWPDLFAVGGDPGYPPRLYRNLGDGRFEAAHHLIPELPAYEMSGSVFADYDNDGDPDIYIYTDNTQWALHGDNLPDGPPNLLLRNLLVELGGRVPARRPLFEEAAAAAGVDDLAATPYGPLPGHRSKAASWLDYDRDGCVDLYVSHLVINSPGARANRDRLFRNLCDGTFTDATADAGLYQGITAWRAAFLVLGAHLDADLWPDLYVVNVAGDNANRSSHLDQIFRNEEGSFTQVFRDWYWIGDDAQAGMGIDTADVDGNGTWDLYISDLKSGGTPLEDEPWGNVLYLGKPRGSYADNSAPNAGVTGDDSWGVNFLDADHDGDEDLFVVTMAGSRIDLFYSNDGDGTFRNVARQAGVRVRDGRGSAVADYDRDGDLDVAVVNQDGPVQLFRNDSELLGGALQLDLVGTDSNRSAIGAVIKVRSGVRVQMRQVKGGSSGHSQNSLAVHFGLGGAMQADVVEVFWPAGGVVRWHDQPSGQRLRLVEGSACSGMPAAHRCRETAAERPVPAEG